MQSANDVKNKVTKRLLLVADRAALLMVQPSANVTSLVVRAKLADGRTLGPLTMNAPAKLPATDGGRPAYSAVKYSALLPREWIQIGATLEVGQGDFSSPRSVALSVTPATTLTHHTIPVYLFGARAAQSVVPDWALSSASTNGYTLDQEYQQKLPVANLAQVTTGAVTLDQLAVPARNDDQFCYPAMSFGSWADFKAAGGDTNARIYRLLSDMRGPAANRDGNFAAGFYGFVQTVDGGRQVAASTGGGLGGGGVGTSGGDYRPDQVYSAIFNHEMGHAYGLPHADAAADAGDYPYPMGTKSGSTWGYDALKNQLLTTLEYSGQSCDGRTVDGTCFQRTPMSGGDDDRDGKTYRWNAFSDYQAAQMQEGFLDKVFRDDSYDGGYKRWNRGTGAFEKLSASDRARIGTDVLKTGQQVQTVIGTVSHFKPVTDRERHGRDAGLDRQPAQAARPDGAGRPGPDARQRARRLGRLLLRVQRLRLHAGGDLCRRHGAAQPAVDGLPRDGRRRAAEREGRAERRQLRHLRRQPADRPRRAGEAAAVQHAVRLEVAGQADRDPRGRPRRKRLPAGQRMDAGRGLRRRPGRGRHDAVRRRGVQGGRRGQATGALTQTGRPIGAHFGPCVLQEVL
jgi:hypothetical protein